MERMYLCPQNLGVFRSRFLRFVPTPGIVYTVTSEFSRLIAHKYRNTNKHSEKYS